MGSPCHFPPTSPACCASHPHCMPAGRAAAGHKTPQFLLIGREIATEKLRKFPTMSPVSRLLYPRMMTPFLEVQHEYDKGFYVSDACMGCETCRKVCPCNNITVSGKRPVWNHRCEGCNACVVYCPTKAIQFRAPDAYVKLDNIITRRLGLPEKRTRYHHPDVTAADLAKDREDIGARLP